MMFYQNSRMLLLKRFFSAVLLCLSGMLIVAQEQADSLSLNEMNYLDEVIIVSNHFTEIIPTQKLKGKELERLNSFSVADAIRYFSGVQLKDYGGVGGLKTVNIRSMGSNQVGIFYNGIQLGNAQNGQIDLGKFSLENLEEIALYNGQKSDIFQSAREFGNGGSIYLTTKRPKFEKDENTNLKATMKAGSFDLLNPSVLFEHKLSNNLSASLNAEWINSSGKYKFRYKRMTPSGELAYDTTAVRHNGDIDAFRAEGSLNGYLDEGFWKVHVYHYTSERGIPGAIVNNVWRRGERLWDRNTFIQNAFQYKLSPKLETRVSMKYAFDFTHYMSNDDRQQYVDNTYKQKEAYASWVNKYEIVNNWDVSLAYDFQWNQLSEFADASRRTHWLSLATAFTLSERFKMQGSILGTFANEKMENRGSVPNEQVWTPAVFMSYQPFKKQGLVFRAFYKKSFRLPTFNDLYYSDIKTNYLKPEHVTQYNWGMLYDIARPNRLFSYFSFGADVYYNEVKDKIVAYPKDQQFFWTILNLGQVEIKGLDVNTMFSLTPSVDWNFTGKLQYSYQEAIDVTDSSDAYYKDQIPYVPLHSGSAIAMISYKTWGLNYSFVYVGERYNQQENINYNHVQPWYTNDVSFSKDFVFKSCKLKISAEVNNLFSQDYDVILNYPMPKRNYRLAVSVSK